MNLSPKCDGCGYEFDPEETWYSDYSELGVVHNGDCEDSKLICPNLDCNAVFHVRCVHIIAFENIDSDEACT